MPAIAKNGKIYGATPNYDDILDTSHIVASLKPDYSKSVSHIGMIIHSTTLDTEEKVKSIYGGTHWSLIEGRVLLGSSSTHDVNSTGGSETNTLSIDNLPAHAHGLNNHTHGLAGHVHGLADHTHYIPSLSGSAASISDNGSLYKHIHGLSVGRSNGGGGRTDWGLTAAGAHGGNVLLWPTSGTSTSLPTAGPDYISHAHSISTNAAWTGGNSGNTGPANGDTTGPSNNATTNTGSGTEVNNMMPYKTVYIWERVS